VYYNRFSRAIAGLLSVLILTTSCASTTTITSSPPGAKVTLNGMYAGETPYRLTDTKPTGAVNSVTLKLEGYETKNVAFSKNEEVNVGAVIGGIFFFFPFIWTMGYMPMHNYELTPEETPEN
jgi:hypothetical protein